MRYVQGTTTARVWEKSLRLFFEGTQSNRVTSRGDGCTEVEDVLFDVKHPGREPVISPRFPKSLVPFVEEFRSRLISRQSGQTSKLNNRMYNWPKRDGGSLNQHEIALNLISRSPDGRYSIISFWDPEEELESDTQVGPLLVYPRLRHGRLNITVVSRSLDAITGAMQVLVGFAGYQIYVAQELGAETGSLRVLALSYQLLDLDVPRVLARPGEAP